MRNIRALSSTLVSALCTSAILAKAEPPADLPARARLAALPIRSAPAWRPAGLRALSCLLSWAALAAGVGAGGSVSGA